MDCNNQVVTIEKIVNGGYGLVRSAAGKTVFVRYGLPGEAVTIAISEAKKRIDFGHVVEVREPSPARIDPPCPYYAQCGGCDLQHTGYQSQCGIKDAIFSELFLRSVGDQVTNAGELVKPILKSPSDFSYRHRIRLKIGDDGTIGFSHFRSNRIVSISTCLLAAKPINACLAQLPASSNLHKLARSAEELEIILNPDSNRVALLFHTNRPPRPADKNLARSLCRSSEVLDRVFFCGRRFALNGPYSDSEEQQDRLMGCRLAGDPPLQLKWEIGGFSQVNLQQNSRLINLVLALSRADKSDRILDLYCGMGNFSVPLATRARDVYGIEAQGSAVRSARANARSNHLANCTFSKSDVVQGCQTLTAQKEMFDILVCDPPRRGMADLVDLAAGLTRKRIIYVSCDPATLCRDLKKLVEHGFTIAAVQPVDMFPQTHHIETVVLLEKR